MLKSGIPLLTNIVINSEAANEKQVFNVLQGTEPEVGRRARFQGSREETKGMQRKFSRPEKTNGTDRKNHVCLKEILLGLPLRHVWPFALMLWC